MKGEYTALVKKNGRWWVGVVTEIPGVVGQARTKAQLLDNLREALADILEWNRSQAILSAKEDLETFEVVTLVV